MSMSIISPLKDNPPEFGVLRQLTPRVLLIILATSLSPRFPFSLMLSHTLSFLPICYLTRIFSSVSVCCLLSMTRLLWCILPDVSWPSSLRVLILGTRGPPHQSNCLSCELMWYRFETVKRLCLIVTSFFLLLI